MAKGKGTGGRKKGPGVSTTYASSGSASLPAMQYSPLKQPGSTQSPDWQPEAREIANHNESLGSFEDGYDSDGNNDPDLEAEAEVACEELIGDTLDGSSLIQSMAIGTVNFHLQARGIAEPSKLKSETPPHKKMLAAEKKSYLAGIWGKPITNEAAHAQAGGQTAAAAEKKLSFAPGTKWVTLQTSGEVADPPLPDCFHAPTDPDCVGGVKKMDYGAVFDRDEFTTKPDPKTKKRTTPKKKGGPNPKFVSLHKLGVQSRPVDWYRSLIPRRRDYDKVEGMPKPILTFSDMAMYSNAKA